MPEINGAAINGKSPSHNRNGDLLNDGSTRSFTWSGRSEILSVTTQVAVGTTVKESFTYDGLQRRISRTDATGTTYFIHDGWNVIAEYRRVGTTNVLQRRYLWGEDLSGSLQGAGGVGGLVQAVDFTSGNAGSYHDHYDGNGNVVEITNVSATVVASYRYDAFGRTLVKAGTYADTNRYRFSTKPLELTSGLYYYGYRFYDPLHGRWTTRDLIAEDGGFKIYAMTENSLISAYDVLGMANVPKVCCSQGQNLVKACGTGEWCCSGNLTIKQAKDGSWYESCGVGEAESEEEEKMKHKITWRSVLIVLASLVCVICYTVYAHTIKWGKISHDSSNILLMRDRLTGFYLSNKAFPDKLTDAVANDLAAEYQYVNCGTNCFLISKASPYVLAIIKPSMSECIVMYNYSNSGWEILK